MHSSSSMTLVAYQLSNRGLCAPFCTNTIFSDDYEELIEAAEELLPAVSVSLLKLSLSLRQYSPRLDMFNKVCEH